MTTLGRRAAIAGVVAAVGSGASAFRADCNGEGYTRVAER